jgi:hypothetical protein
MLMFGINFQKHSKLDPAVDAVLNSMEIYGPESEEFETMIGRLERLKKLQSEERGGRISPDTMAIVAGNLLGILIMVKYERFNVLTSKGLGLLLRTQTNK